MRVPRGLGRGQVHDQLLNNKQISRGIYCAKYYGQGGGNGAGEKMKNEAVGNKMKKKEKGKRKKGKGK